MEAYSAPVGYVFSLNAGGRSGTFDVVAGDFSTELAADTENGIYIGLADDPTATTKVAKRDANVLWVEHFGAVEGEDSGLAAANTVAINACDAFCAANNVAEMRFKGGIYRHDNTLTFTGRHRITGASARLGTRLEITTDNLGIDCQAQGTVDGIISRGGLVGGKTTDGIHIFGERMDIGYLAANGHYNGIVYKKGNVSQCRHLITTSNTNIGFWADVSSINSNGAEFWIDSRGNGSHGIVFGEVDLGDTISQPRQCRGYLSAQANGGYGVVLRSRTGIFDTYCENNTTGGVLFEGAGAFGNVISTSTSEGYKDASDASGSPGSNVVYGIQRTTSETGVNGQIFNKSWNLRDYDLVGDVDFSQTGDRAFAFEFGGTSTSHSLRLTNDSGDSINLVVEGNIASQGEMFPLTDNSQSSGRAGNRWSELFAGTATVNTSDGREKTDVLALTNKEMQAWSNVQWITYKWIEAKSKKGDAARTHAGAIAQQVQAAFEDQGLDAFSYGLLCYDVLTKTEVIVEKDAEGSTVYETYKEADGTPASRPREIEIEVPLKELDGSYKYRMGLRYSECFAFEAAYNRQRLDKIEEQLNSM
jgi:hypothetical protein